MKIVSVNVGLPREVVWKGITVRTAIFKQPVAGTVAMRQLNLAGDQQADLTVHGGSDKAVYVYPVEHYEYWRKQLPDVSFSWGAFGENLTTEGLSEDTVCIGDLLKTGSAILQVTQPRMPCYKLELRFNREDMIRRLGIRRELEVPGVPSTELVEQGGTEEMNVAELESRLGELGWGSGSRAYYSVYEFVSGPCPVELCKEPILFTGIVVETKRGFVTIKEIVTDL